MTHVIRYLIDNDNMVALTLSNYQSTASCICEFIPVVSTEYMDNLDKSRKKPRASASAYGTAGLRGSISRSFNISRETITIRYPHIRVSKRSREARGSI